MSLEDHRERDPGGRRNPPDRIEIDGDVLILDSEFCRVALAGATRRTASRLEAQGLPYVLIAGRKFRPLNEGLRWLASRIQRRGSRRRRV